MNQIAKNLQRLRNIFRWFLPKELTSGCIIRRWQSSNQTYSNSHNLQSSKWWAKLKYPCISRQHLDTFKAKNCLSMSRNTGSMYWKGIPRSWRTFVTNIMPVKMNAFYYFDWPLQVALITLHLKLCGVYLFHQLLLLEPDITTSGILCHTKCIWRNLITEEETIDSNLSISTTITKLVKSAQKIFALKMVQVDSDLLSWRRRHFLL